MTTPGPWKVHCEGLRYVVRDIDGSYIVETLRLDHAKLIAASPELYVALKAIYKWMRKDNDSDSIDLVLFQMENALTKVEGK